MRTLNCAQCGYTLDGSEEVCPGCKKPLRGAELTPLGGATPPAPPPSAPPRRSLQEEQEELYRAQSVEPAPGQDSPASSGYIKFIAKQDPLLAVVLGLQALNVVINLASGQIFGGIISAAIFWGVYTFQLWGWWVAMVLAGLGVLFAVLAMAVNVGSGLIYLAIPLFTIIVLGTRRAHFG